MPIALAVGMRQTILTVGNPNGESNSLKKPLEQLGYFVRHVESVEDGIDMLSRGAFDAVLADICIGKGSGLQLVGRSRQRGLDNRFFLVIRRRRGNEGNYLTYNGVAGVISVPADRNSLENILKLYQVYQPA